MDDEIIIEAMIHDTSNSSKKKKSKKGKKKNKKINNQKTSKKVDNKKDEFKSINKGKVKNKTEAVNYAVPAREKINAKQALKLKKKKEIKIMATVLLVLFTIILFLSSPLFSIKDVTVSGTSKLTNDEVVSASGITTNINIFALNKLKAKKKILENPYVADVYIKRNYPNNISIEVNEKVPTFMIQFANSYIYVNNQGYMLEISTEPLNLPVLLGIKTDLSNVKPGKRLDVEDLKKFNILIQIMDITKNFELNTLITRIDITDSSDYIVYMDSEGKKIYLGDAIDLNTKILPLAEILNQTTGKSGEIFLNMDLNEQNPRFRESY